MPNTQGKLPNSESRPPQSQPRKRDVDLLFGSGARADVLWVLLMHPVLTFADIARFTQRDPKDVRRALTVLKQLELVIETEPHVSGHMSREEMYRLRDEKWLESEMRRSGRMYYNLNEDHPWVPGLKVIFENSSIGIIPLLREGLAPIEGIEIAFVFGSCATGAQTPESDIDLLTIGNQNPETVADFIDGLEGRIGRKIDYFEYAPEDWVEALRDHNYFARSVMAKPRIFLIGNNEKLERISKT